MCNKHDEGSTRTFLGGMIAVGDFWGIEAWSGLVSFSPLMERRMAYRQKVRSRVTQPQRSDHEAPYPHTFGGVELARVSESRLTVTLQEVGGRPCNVQYNMKAI